MAAAGGQCFVEWKEQFVSKEKGNRVVHYFLKDNSGESVLAVVGTERSVRHMFYVVSEEFLNVDGADKSVHAGYRWRSRREVVNWLTSMLSKKHRQVDCNNESPKRDPNSGIIAQPIQLLDYKGRLSRNLNGHTSDILWSGVAWKCGKQLKHYPAFCRNGVTIAIQSFVFVMAEEDNRHLAYLEDMYEDRKGQKKVKVRWFHHNQEVLGVISLRNSHPKEVFITPYAQVISVECVDGPAIVLTREHYEKCLPVIPHDLLARVHLCFRQFKSNRVKPFKLNKLRGYYDQPIFSCVGPDYLEVEEFSPGENVKVGAKRTRSCRGRQMLPYKASCRDLRYNMLSRKMIFRKHVENQVWDKQLFKANEKIELLCQDSGIRGCWFRCTVLQVARRQIKVQYDDVKDEDGCGNLEEWVPAFRLAMPDRLGMRCSGRPTIRPALPHKETDLVFEIGDPVDAWWSDGWWEGVLTGICDSDDGNLQVYIPSECLFLNLHRKNLRISREWLGDQWVDIKANPDILSVISAANNPDNKNCVSSTVIKETESEGLRRLPHKVPTNTKLSVVEENLYIAGSSACDGDKENTGTRVKDTNEKHSTDSLSSGDDHDSDDGGGGKDDKDCDVDEDDTVNKLVVEKLETSVQRSEAEPMEAVA
ncbi:hypothetical protein LguiA_023401 [Lonicera macranthoides]